MAQQLNLARAGALLVLLLASAPVCEGYHTDPYYRPGSCRPGYHPVSSRDCALNVCKCPGGHPKKGDACLVHGAQGCWRCVDTSPVRNDGTCPPESMPDNTGAAIEGQSSAILDYSARGNAGAATRTPAWIVVGLLGAVGLVGLFAKVSSWTRGAAGAEGGEYESAMLESGSDEGEAQELLAASGYQGEGQHSVL